MKSNESAFHWLQGTGGNEERREYPIREESPLLAMTDMIWSPPFVHDASHRHNCMEIGLCISGRGSIRIGSSGDIATEPGMVVVVPEGVDHSQQSTGQAPCRWRYIAVDEKRLLGETPGRCREEIARLINAARGQGIVMHEGEPTQDVTWLIQKMFDLRCRYAEEATAELEAMLLLILTRMARDPQMSELSGAQSRRELRSVEPALLYIAERYAHEIKVSQLARSCAMSESYFRKTFADTMGIPPLDYVNRYRVQRAMHMLSMSDVNVSQAAQECGFSSMATFHRNFIRYVGQNPTQWRREYAMKGEMV